jgi:hypothetical protein
MKASWMDGVAYPSMGSPEDASSACLRFFDPIRSGLVGPTPAPCHFGCVLFPGGDLPAQISMRTSSSRSIFRRRVSNFSVLALTSLGNYTKFEEWKYHDSPCGIVSCFHFQPVNFLTQKRSPRNTGEDHVGGHVTAPNPREALDGLMREME